MKDIFGIRKQVDKINQSASVLIEISEEAINRIDDWYLEEAESRKEFGMPAPNLTFFVEINEGVYGCNRILWQSRISKNIATCLKSFERKIAKSKIDLEKVNVWLLYFEEDADIDYLAAINKELILNK